MGSSKGIKSDRISSSAAISNNSISGGISISNSFSSNNPKGITLYRYSPENVPHEVLKNIFVGRDDLFDKTFKELETAGKNKTPRFYLIVGSRGIGKSHFLIMLYHKIKQELSSLYIPVKFAEEEYSVYRASDFFLRILQERNEDISGILSLNDEEEILDASLDRLKEIAKNENKTYLIFVENLHEVFRQFDAKEVQKLRSIFQKHDFFSIIASSPIVFPGIADNEEPFYNFFRIQHLRELSSDEIKILLKKIAEIEGNREFLENFKKYEPRIEGIAHLTGGSPRLVIFFYELITRDNFEDIEKVFFKILDEHTPYYQEIFQLLTGQRRLIFDTVISSESPLTPKQIAGKSRVDAQVVVTQLRRLEKDGYVLSRPAGRETYYEVRERLFRLWRDMRQPLGRNRISVFLDFLKLWYTSEEQKELFDKKFHLLESGNKEVLKDLCYYVEALSSECKVEALLKLTPKIIELGEWEEADYDIQELNEIASKSKDKDLKAKSLIFQSLFNYKNNEKATDVFKRTLKFGSKDYFDLLNSGYFKMYQELVKAFDKVLELNPDDEYALSRKGSILFLLERYEESIGVFDKVLKLNPKDWYTLLMKEIALSLLKNDTNDINIFDKALELNPEDQSALSEKGFVLNSLGRYAEAIDIFDKILEMNPTTEHALTNKGFALISLNKYSEAIEIADKVLNLNPASRYALLNKGVALASLKRYEESVEVYNKILELNSEDESALFNKGLVLISLNKYSEAVETFDKILKINPINKQVLVNKGFALASLTKYSEAIKTFDKFLEYNPIDNYVLMNKGSCLFCLNRYEETIEILNKILQLNPEDEYVLLRKGIVLVLLNRYLEAVDVFDKVLELNPINEDSLSRKGSALVSLNRYSEAIEIFDRVLELDPANRYALLNKGGSLALLARYEESIENFNKILGLNPVDEEALLNKGAILASQKRYKEAIDVYNKILELNTTNKQALLKKGFALISLNKYSEAIDVLNKYLELNSEDSYALSMKGISLALLTRYEESIETFNKILGLNPADEGALLNKGSILASQKRYEEATEVFIKAKSIASDESFKINSAFSLIKVYTSLSKITEAADEIESIKDMIYDQNSHLTEEFINLCWNLIFEELKVKNLGNGKKYVRIVFDLETRLEKKAFETSMMDFFKTVVDSGEFEVLKTVIDEIKEIKGVSEIIKEVNKENNDGNYPDILKPLVKAVEIVETKDVQKYYKLQVEEREIVVEIVQKISRSGDLLPPEYKKR